MTWSAEPGRTFYCVFCRDVVALAVGDPAQFRSHMQTTHSVFFEFDILLAINFINRAGKDKIVRDVKRKEHDENQIRSKTAEITWPEAYEDEEPKDPLMSSPDSNMEQLDNVEKFFEVNSLSICNENYDDKEKRRLEIEKMQYQCKKCKKKFLLRQMLENHLNQTYPCVKPKCAKCSKVLKNGKDLSLHMNRKPACDKHKCKNCNLLFKSLSALRKHRRTKICRGVKEYRCGKCQRTFKYDNLYQKHLASITRRPCVTPGPAHNNFCKDCKKQFCSLQAYNNHQSKKDRICVKVHACEFCGELFKETKLMKHIQVCAPVECDKCGERIKKENLKVHKKTACEWLHQQPKCDDCKKIFCSEQIVRKHMEKFRGTCAQIFKCGDCGNSFTGPSTFKLHKRLSLACYKIATAQNRENVVTRSDRWKLVKD